MKRTTEPEVKKRRWHRGTQALREIRRLQRGTKPLIQYAPMHRLVGTMLGGMRMTRSAMDALRTALEYRIHDTLALSNRLALHRGCKTLMERDHTMARAIERGLGQL